MNSLLTIYQTPNTGWQRLGITEGYYRDRDIVILTSQKIEVRIFVN